jgi:hypothetical protein
LAFGAYQENNKELLSKTKDLLFYTKKGVWNEKHIWNQTTSRGVLRGNA